MVATSGSKVRQYDLRQVFTKIFIFIRDLRETEMPENHFDSEQKSLTLVLIIIMVLIPILILLIFFLICCKSCWRVYRRKSDRRKLMIAAGYDVESDMESDTESWNTDFNDNDS